MSDSSKPAPARLAAEELFQHTDFLRALARGLVRDEHAAEDLVQETLAAGLRAPQRPARGLRAWLAGAAQHLAVDAHRRRVRGERHEPQREARATEDPLAIAGRLEVQRELAAAVAGLREPYREAIYLRFYESHPPRVLAERLGVPIETVKTRLARALDQLRERLDARHDGERERWYPALVALLHEPSPAPGGPAAQTPILGGLMHTPLTWSSAAVALAVVTWAFVEAPHANQQGELATFERASSAQIGPQPPRDTALPGAVRSSQAGRADPEDSKLRGWRLAGLVTDSEEAPVVDALVELPYGFGTRFDAELAPFVLRTDQAGRFALELEVPPDVSSHASLAAIARVRTPDGREGVSEYAQVDPRRFPHGETIRLDVSLAEPRADLAHAVGRVVDASGRPLADIPIAARTPERVTHPVTASDAQGYFDLELEPDPQLGGWPDKLFPARVVAGSAVLGTVESAPFDSRVEARAELGELVLDAGARLQGRVLAADGAPVAGLELRVVPEEDPRARSWAGRVTTDPTGRFELRGVLPGRYWLSTRELWRDARPSLLGPIETGSIANLRFDVRVLTVRVVDEAGRGVPGVPVQYATGRGEGMSHTDGRRGEAQFAVRPGRLRLIVSQDDSQEDRGAPSAPDAAWSAHELMLTEADHQPQVELVLDFDRPRGDLRVRAVDETGAAIEGALRLGLSLEGWRGPVLILRTDERGFVAGVPAGEYQLSVQRADARGAGARHITKLVPCEVRAGETSELPVVMQRGGWLALYLRTAELEAIPDSELELELIPRLDDPPPVHPDPRLGVVTEPASPFHIRLDATGRTRLLRAGNYLLRVTAPGFLEVERQVLVRAGEVTPLSVQLTPE